MRLSTISVSDMHCAACASKIRRALAGLEDVRTTHINPVRRQVLVEHGETLTPLDILNTIESAGFTPTLAGLDDHDARQRSLLKRLGIAGLAMMQVMMAAIALYAGHFDGMEPAYERLLQYTSLVFTIPVVCYSAMPFFTSALGSLRPGAALSMDVPVALAIAVAFGTSLYHTLNGSGEVYYDSVVMFTFLLLGARYIDNRLQHRFDLTGALLSALPRTATVERDGEPREVPAASLAPADVVWVAEGAQVPVDGRLLSEAARLDEALLTGETDRVEKSRGDEVFAGTLNRGAGFRLQATRAFDQSRIADIAELADQAAARQAPITRLTDRIAGIFIPTVLGLAAVVFVAWQFVAPDRALIAALTVLVVSCPCALSLATPAALTAAMTRLRQLGVVLTSSEALERAVRVDRVYIDKTGTLTEDRPEIAAVTTFEPSWSEADCLDIAGALQRHSSHPYARAFSATGPDRGFVLTAVDTVTGGGVRGLISGRTVRIGSAAFALGADRAGADDRAVFLSLDGAPLARFDLTNRIRPDAAEAVQALRRLGVEPLMLSGDSVERCAETADRLGIGYLPRQSPEAKLAAIRADQASGRTVLMLGDGINDVPVLAGADLSAAVVEASDMVKSKADVLLLSRRLAPLTELFRVALATRRITHQNLIWAALYNLTAIPIAALGLMPPWLAALGMASSSTLVMLNATRLLSEGQNERAAEMEA
ncbi:MAG: heavy metal translocating P-type ATPase [Pseudomonadales bacterium]